MSTVYLAHDPRFERDVAIKLLPLELLHQPTFRRRFEREAKVVAALDHPAIVPVYDFGDEDGQPFLVMRFMTGGSLLDRLKQGAITIKEAAAIISRLAPALDEVHAHGVIHRDLKPSNILFDQRGDPYLSDFGTAKLAQAQTKLTDTGGAVGTPAYMSPEQIQGDEEIDGRSDIYSLGVILFEMLTGKHPYETDTPLAVAVKHIFEPVPHILDMDPNLPVECQEIISKAMAKNRADRYVTADAFAVALTKIANKIETTTMRTLNGRQQNQTGKRFALLISVDEYEDPILAQLVKPAANVQQLAQILKDPDIGGFDEVIILKNKPAHIIRRNISRFFANKTHNDFLLLYYIGHAAVGTRSRLFLTAANTEHKLLRGTAIPAGFVADEMDNSPSKQQVLIMDCHFSNAIDTDLPSLVGQTVNTGATFARNGHERTVITATDSTQYNWYKDEIRGKATPSQFTRHLIQGLQSGTADLDHNGVITIDEMFAYIYDCVARNSVDEQIQAPRKWTPYNGQEPNSLVIAHNPHPFASNGTPMLEQEIRHSRLSNGTGRLKIFRMNARRWIESYKRWAIVGAVVVLLISAFTLIGQFERASGVTETPEQNVAAALATTAVSPQTPLPAATTAATETAVFAAAATTAPTETASPIPTNTATVVPTETATETATATVIAAAAEQLYTTALLSSSIFAAPDGDADELSFVGVGDEVEILGRAEFGEWLYVRDADGVTGYAYGPRFDWSGDYETLPLAEDTDTAPVMTDTAVDACGGACPSLSIDLYPLPGIRCEDDGRYRDVYISGEGGDETYTYYWDGQKVGGPIRGQGFAFEISSSDGAAIIGIGKVVSGDGQTVEKELFISNFSCGN